MLFTSWMLPNVQSLPIFVNSSIIHQPGYSGYPEPLEGFWHSLPSFQLPLLFMPNSQCNRNNSGDILILHPRLIHQSWKTRRLHKKIQRKWVESWLNTHEDYTYLFWSDGDLETLVKRAAPQLEDLWKKLSNIEKADVSRYLIMWVYGGIYVDVDFEALSGLEGDLANNCVLLGYETQVHIDLFEHHQTVSNAILASVPRHPLWEALLSAIIEKFDSTWSGGTNDPVEMTGPRILTKVLADFPDIQPLEWWRLYPTWTTRVDIQEKCKEDGNVDLPGCVIVREHPDGYIQEDTIAIHHWACSWCTETPEYGLVVGENVVSEAHCPNITGEPLTLSL